MADDAFTPSDSDQDAAAPTASAAATEPAPAPSPADTSDAFSPAASDTDAESHHLQAFGSGLASGLVTTPSALTVDALRNTLELGKAAAGTAYAAGANAITPLKLPAGETEDSSGRASKTPGGLYHYINKDGIEVYSKNPPPADAREPLRETQADIPKFLQPESDEDAKKDIGSSDWVLEQMRHHGLQNYIDAENPNSTVDKYLHIAGQGIGAGAGGEGTLVATEAKGAARFGREAVKDVLAEGAKKDIPIAGAAGAAAGAAQQGVADLSENSGLDPNSSTGRLVQTAAGVIAGEGAAGRLHRATTEAPAPAISPPPRPGGVTPEDLVNKAKARQAAAAQTEAAAKTAANGPGPTQPPPGGAGSAPAPTAADSPKTGAAEATPAAVVVPHKDGFGVKVGDGSIVSTHANEADAKATAASINNFHASRNGAPPAAPSEHVRDVARQYANDNGIDYRPPDDQRAIDPAKAKKIAAAYDSMEHSPDDPVVKASYDALKSETMAQYQAMKNAGVKLDFIDPSKPDPYKGNPRGVIEDARNNNHMWVYPTEAGFGSDAHGVPLDHPMLEQSGEQINGRPATYNDIFRAVHDYYGHAAEGNGFRENGEYNAYRNHAALYSDAARPALATETLGQNAWVNRGPHGDTNRTATQENTVYAPQKAGLLPKSIYDSPEPASGPVTAKNGMGLTAGNRPFSIITSDRSERTPGENAAHRTQLERELQHEGVEFKPTEGVYKGGTPEKGFAVFHKDEQTPNLIESLGAKHNQESVLHVDKNREGTFAYTDGSGKIEQMGKLRAAPQMVAEKQEGFTRDAEGNHYVLTGNDAGPSKPQYGTPPTQDGTPPMSSREIGPTSTPQRDPLAWMKEPVNSRNIVSFMKPEDDGTAHGEVPKDQQWNREAAIRSQGITEVRKSAITGNTKDAATDWATAKVKNASGDRLAQVIQHENDALVNGADRLHSMTGGTAGMREPDMYNRGNAHQDAVDSYNQAIQDEKQKQYDAADAAMSGKPLPALNEFENYLKNNKAQFLMSSEGKQLYEGTNALLKQMGFHGKNETFNPPTVQQVEALRQELGKAWTPQNSRFIGDMKDALDLDVAKATGEQAYARARELNTLQQKMLKEPKLVNAIRTPDSGDNLARPSAASIEKLPSAISNAPVDQFAHYVNVLEQMGAGGDLKPDLPAKAAKAYNEIRAQFINEYKAAGVGADGKWNARTGNNYLESHNLKMSMVFTPEEMNQIKLHNDAAAALKMDKSYPGAGPQAYNVLQALGGRAAKGAAEAIGAGVGGVSGYLAAKGVEHIGGKLLERAMDHSVESRIQKLDKPQEPFNKKAPSVKKKVADAAEQINGYASGSDEDTLKNFAADATGQINGYASASNPKGLTKEQLKRIEKSAGGSATAAANVAANAQQGEAGEGDEEAGGLLAAERGLAGAAGTSQQQPSSTEEPTGLLGNALKKRVK